MAATLLLGCNGERAQERVPPPSDRPARGPVATAPAGATGVAAPDDTARFTACLLAELIVDPQGSANALRVFARSAPAADARRVIGAIVDRADRFPARAQAKLLGEAAWALADAGDLDAARAAALLAAALRPDGEGGRLTALATLGRVGPVTDAEALATGPMTLAVVAFGAAVGGHRQDAARLRAGIEADPTAMIFVRSAVHLKLVAALGDVPAITRALGEPLDPLLDGGAVVEGGAHVGNAQVMMAGVAALASARGVAPRAQARALVGAAGTAAAAGHLSVVEAAIAAFDALPATARGGLELAPAVSYITVGAVDQARARMAAAGPTATAEYRLMFAAGLAAADGGWSELPPRIPAVPALTTDVWGRALTAKLDATSRARVLDAVCPQ